MGMNPDTNQFEELQTAEDHLKEALGQLKESSEKRLLEMLPTQLVRPDGTPVPEHWSIFKLGEEIVIKTHVFKVGYIGESALLLEPVRPATVNEQFGYGPDEEPPCKG